MEAIDSKKLDTAITYVQRIAEGNNPVNNMPAENDAVLKNPNVIRCMFFVKEVLEEVKRNNGFVGRRIRKNDRQEFPTEILDSFSYREDVAISKFVGQINELIDENIYQKLCYKQILKWLKLHGFLTEELSRDSNKKITLPTEKGVQLGIRAEERSSARDGDYKLLIYGKQAQEYIVRNMEAILKGESAD